MFDRIGAMVAASDAMQSAQSGVATSQLIPALLFIVLAVTAMFVLLFRTNGSDATSSRR